MVLYSIQKDFIVGKKTETIKKTKKDGSDYDKIIRRLERENKRLKSENKTLQDALNASEEYLIAISSEKTLQYIFEEIDKKTEVKTKQQCPKCNSEHMKRINLGNIQIVSCSCGYRNRTNESGPTQA